MRYKCTATQDYLRKNLLAKKPTKTKPIEPPNIKNHEPFTHHTYDHSIFVIAFMLLSN